MKFSPDTNKPAKVAKIHRSPKELPLTQIERFNESNNLPQTPNYREKSLKKKVQISTEPPSSLKGSGSHSNLNESDPTFSNIEEKAKHYMRKANQLKNQDLLEKSRFMKSEVQEVSPKKEAEVEFIDPKIDAERMLERHRAKLELQKMSTKA